MICILGICVISAILLLVGCNTIGEEKRNSKGTINTDYCDIQYNFISTYINRVGDSQYSSYLNIKPKMNPMHITIIKYGYRHPDIILKETNLKDPLIWEEACNYEYPFSKIIISYINKEGLITNEYFKIVCLKDITKLQHIKKGSL